MALQRFHTISHAGRPGLAETQLWRYDGTFTKMFYHLKPPIYKISTCPLRLWYVYAIIYKILGAPLLPTKPVIDRLHHTWLQFNFPARHGSVVMIIRTICRWLQSSWWPISLNFYPTMSPVTPEFPPVSSHAKYRVRGIGCVLQHRHAISHNKQAAFICKMVLVAKVTISIHFSDAPYDMKMMRWHHALPFDLKK